MSWKIPRLRSQDAITDQGGVISFMFQKWLDLLCSRVDNQSRVVVPGDLVLPSDYLLIANATAAPFTLVLPLAADSQGRVLTVKKTDFTGNAVTIAGAGAEVIDWVATQTLAVTNASLTMTSDGTQWWII